MSDGNPWIPLSADTELIKQGLSDGTYTCTFKRSNVNFALQPKFVATLDVGFGIIDYWGHSESVNALGLSACHCKVLS